MKKETGTLDATPSKRLYQSIISDYDLDKAIAELVDNAFDIWTKGNRIKSLLIEVNLDPVQQTITVKDNAGGIKREQLSFVIAPGHTSNNNDGHTIGIFGVGSKRAVVAIAQEIRIKTSTDPSKKYLVEFDDNWLEKQDVWKLPVYEIDEDIVKGTVIELQRLRAVLTKEKIEALRDHLSAVYAKFLSNTTAKILLNGKAIRPITFDNWAYPPQFEPREYSCDLKTTSGTAVHVHVLAGLTLETTGQDGEYGMYFYCNDRLVARGLRNFDVGFSKGHAGKPHFNLSLARVLVSLSGQPNLMPWNSSKSGIHTTHEVFLALQEWLIVIMKDYASLSRRYQGEWSDQVFKYPEGEIVKVIVEDPREANTSYLPPLPKSKPRYADIIKQKNQSVVDKHPWARGAYESIIAVDLILKQHFEQRNRIALMLLDSELEIAFKDYLVNEQKTKHYTDADLQRIFKARHLVQNEVKLYLTLPPKTWTKIDYYYKQRCEIVHKRSSVSIPDEDVNDYRKVVQFTLSKMFKLKF